MKKKNNNNNNNGNNNWLKFKPKAEATEDADWLCIKYVQTPFILLDGALI